MKKLLLSAIFMCCLWAAGWAQTRQISGTVVEDSTNTGLPDVSVIIKGTNQGATTNQQGGFTIMVPNGKSKVDLVFSSIGYATLTQSADAGQSITVRLQKATNALNEVVVVGYGSVRKRDLTGAIVSVKGDEVKKVAAANVMESVQGKVAGVDIVRTSGAAGANVNVTVRGNRSIIAGNGPLYIVDGIQYTNYQDINPNDVESMEVLKDAASTAIYGSRGANGVIIITTKKGISGKLRVTANAYYGVTEAAGYPVPMTGPEFADLKRQSYRTTGIWKSTADDPKIFTPVELAAVNSNTSTYWPGLLLHKGSQQDYGIGIASGNDKTKVYFSFDYFKEKGLLQNDYSARFTSRLNIDQTITSTFKIGLESQLTYYDQNLRADNILTVANKVLPYFVAYNADTLTKYPGNGAQLNPLMEEQPGAYVNKYNITRILSTAYAEWRPISSLSIRSNLGVTHSSIRNGSFEGANTISRALSSGSISRVNNSRDLNLSWENVINWQKKFNDHSLNLTAVTSYLSFTNDNSGASGTGQLLPSQSFYALQNNPANLQIASNYSASKLISGAFRVNYNYRDKYLLTLTGREDGASVLSAQNKWAFFPSAAAAWRISDEAFMKGQSLLNDLKLRLSYGIAGNSSVNPYQTQSSLMLIPFSWNDQSALAFGLNPQTGNTDLKWELTATENAGLDFSVLKSRISGSFDYYDSKTKDLLLLRQLPATSGVSKILQNIGKVRNTGFEIAINTTNIRTMDFTWNSRITYTRNKERIVELVGHQSDIGNKWIIGYPVNSFYDYEKTGIWQTTDSAVAASYGYKPGDIRVKDLNNDKKITATDDRAVVGSAVPKYSVGFSNDIRFQNFDFNIFIFARIGQMFVSDYANKFEPNAIENGANVNYWTPENPTNDYPRPNAGLSRAALPFATTLGYEDGSFVKIRNITLGYTFPVQLTKRLGINNVRWYVSGKNFFTIYSKVKNYDPEGSGSFERPLTRLVLTGLNIDL